MGLLELAKGRLGPLAKDAIDGTRIKSSFLQLLLRLADLLLIHRLLTTLSLLASLSALLLHPGAHTTATGSHATACPWGCLLSDGENRQR
jgi:hypothetical protein